MSLEKNIPPSVDSHAIDWEDMTIKSPLSLTGSETGVVLFAQDAIRGSASGSALIAKILNQNSLATVLPDSLDASDLQSDPFILADRLVQTARCIRSSKVGMPIGYFATGAGTEAALFAAARSPDLVSAVVVRGGDPHKAVDFFPLIKAPVLLIAPGRDPRGVRAYQEAVKHLNRHSAMNIISKATQSFHEPDALEESTQLASLWFLQHLK